MAELQDTTEDVKQASSREVATATIIVVIQSLILLLNLLLHMVNIAQTPGWDADEGYNLDIAWNLLHGHAQMFTMTYAFVQHPPLYYLILAGAIRTWGYSISTLRGLSAVYALITCAALLVLVRRMLGQAVALWSAFLFTIVPLAFVNTRWGYSYDQLMLLVILFIYTLWSYQQYGERRWLYASCLLCGLALVTDQEALVLLIPLLYVVWPEGWAQRVRALLAGLAIPIVTYVILLIAYRGSFLADILTTLNRLHSGDGVLTILAFAINYQQFLTFNAWLILGIVGLFLIPNREVKVLCLQVLIPLMILILLIRGVNPYFRMAIPLLPFIAIGLAVVTDLSIHRFYTVFMSWLKMVLHSQRELIARVIAGIALAAVIGMPLAVTVASDSIAAAHTIDTQQDSTLVTSTGNVEQVVDFIRKNARPGDLVAASPQVAWNLETAKGDSLIQAPYTTADVLQVAAYTGQQSAFYPAGLPHDRFTTNLSLSHINYFIEDNEIDQLAGDNGITAMRTVLDQVQQWQIVLIAGEYTVYMDTSSSTSPGM